MDSLLYLHLQYLRQKFFLPRPVSLKLPSVRKTYIPEHQLLGKIRIPWLSFTLMGTKTSQRAKRDASLSKCRGKWCLLPLKLKIFTFIFKIKYLHWRVFVRGLEIHRIKYQKHTQNHLVFQRKQPSDGPIDNLIFDAPSYSSQAAEVLGSVLPELLCDPWPSTPTSPHHHTCRSMVFYRCPSTFWRT